MTWTRRTLLQASTLFLLGACGLPLAQRSGGSGDRNQITFWTMQLKPTFESFMNAAIARFTSERPGVQVEWVDVPWSEMETKLLSAYAANTAPDVANLNPQFAAKLAQKNGLLDLGRAITDSERAFYFPNLWKANQLDGLTFGLPWYVATDVTIYNRDLFRRAGLDANRPPKTYAELATMAAQIKQKTGKYAFLLTMDGSQVLEAMVQMGMKLVTATGKAAFNDGVGKAAFAYWVDLYTKQLVPPEMLTESHRKAIELYQAGELALLLTGPQFLKTVAQNAPDIAKVSDVAAQIVGVTGKRSAAVMNLAVPNTSANPELAVQFALFLTSDRNQLEFAKVENSLPSTLKAASDPYFTYLDPKGTAVDKARTIAASQLPQAEVLVPPMKNLDELRKILYEELQLAMLKEKTAAAAIASAAERWDSMTTNG